MKNIAKLLLRRFKTCFSYVWHDVLFDRFYQSEYFEDFPLTDIEQDIARKITFGYGAVAWGSIFFLLWLFLIFTKVASSIPLVILTLIPLILLAIFLGAVSAAIYLDIKWLIKERVDSEREKLLEEIEKDSDNE